MIKVFSIGILFVLSLVILSFLTANLLEKIFPISKPNTYSQQAQLFKPNSTPTPSPTPTPVVIQPTNFKSLTGISFVYQSFNNCGPAALSMDLSYFGINISQQELADLIRPYNNPQGFNDDKSVTLEEFGPVAKSHNLIFYYRPNGTPEKVKLFLANDIPVITRTWLYPDDYIGHFRILTGFDENRQEFIQVDSIEGQRRFSYSQFSKLWQPFNYQYAVITTPEKEEVVKAILGSESEEKIAWTKAKERAQRESNENSQKLYPVFNLATTSYHLGQHQESIQAFEKISNRLPLKMLWYQIEPVKSYYQLKNYGEVISLTDKIFQSGNPSFSEAYILRGNSYLDQGDKEKAKLEYEKSLLYNKILPEAKEKLANINN